jgi:hypothetical protein
MIQQISVFAENRPGKLEKVTRLLAGVNVNIRALAIGDLGEFGVIKLLVDRPQAGVQRLIEAGIAAKLIEVVAIFLDDRVGGLNQAARVLLAKDINAKNAYGFVLEKGKQAVFVFEVEDPCAAGQALQAAGYQLLDEAALTGL